MRNFFGGLLLGMLVVLGAQPALADLDAAVGDYRGGDVAAAVAEFRRLAEIGDAAAQRWLGIAYREGRGVGQSHADARFWLRAAADRGDGEAQVALGDMYFFGLGGASDMAEAARWYRAAATGPRPEAVPPFYLAVSSDRYPAFELGRIVEELVAPRLRGLAGISDIVTVGAPRPVLRLAFDSERLRAYGLTPAEALQALQAQGLALTPTFRDDVPTYEVAIGDGAPSPEAVGALVLGQADGVPIALRDVTMIDLALGEPGGRASRDGQPVVALAIGAQQTAPAYAVPAAVCRMLPELRALLPEGVAVDIAAESEIRIEHRP